MEQNQSQKKRIRKQDQQDQIFNEHKNQRMKQQKQQKMKIRKNITKTKESMSTNIKEWDINKTPRREPKIKIGNINITQAPRSKNAFKHKCQNKIMRKKPNNTIKMIIIKMKDTNSTKNKKQNLTKKSYEAKTQCKTRMKIQF